MVGQTTTTVSPALSGYLRKLEIRLRNEKLEMKTKKTLSENRNETLKSLSRSMTYKKLKN